MQSAIQEAARVLRNQAEALERLECALSLPRDDYNINQALSQLRAVGEDKCLVAIYAKIYWHYGNDPYVNWDVSNNDRFCEGKTLGAAMKVLLAAQTEAPADPVKDVQDKLDELVAPAPMPF